MHRSSIRPVVCSLALLILTGLALKAQIPAQPDIYQHFVGNWVGSDVYLGNGAKKQVDIRITITEKKRKDCIRLDKIYGKKGEPGFTTDTDYLQLIPRRSKVALWGGGGSEKPLYDAKGLPDFAQSGFGQIVGTGKASEDDQATLPLDKQFPFIRLTLTLTKDTFSYKWERGADQDHMKILSIYTLTRDPAS